MLRFIMNTVSLVVPALFPNSLLKFLKGFQFMIFLLEHVHFYYPKNSLLGYAVLLGNALHWQKVAPSNLGVQNSDRKQYENSRVPPSTEECSLRLK